MSTPVCPCRLSRPDRLMGPQVPDGSQACAKVLQADTLHPKPGSVLMARDCIRRATSLRSGLRLPWGA